MLIQNINTVLTLTNIKKSLIDLELQVNYVLSTLNNSILHLPMLNHARHLIGSQNVMDAGTFLQGPSICSVPSSLWLRVVCHPLYILSPHFYMIYII